MGEHNMKISMTVLLCSVTVAWGCGPYFPPSYFNNHQYLMRGDGVSVRFNECVELQLVGEHFYPEWKGKKPVRNAITSAEAHRLDFAAAAKRAGMGAGTETMPWRRYAAFSENLLERLRAGEAVDIPKDVGVFEEFYLYTLGFEQLRSCPENPEPEAWHRLLALPPEARQYRTTWAYYGLTLAAKTFEKTDFYLAKFRRALDERFADTAALEEAVLRHLIRRNPETGLRYLPLVLSAYQYATESAMPESVYWDFAAWRRTDWMMDKPEFLQRMLEDKVGREVMLIIKPGYVEHFMRAGLKSAPMAGLDDTVLCADRLAWHAFEQGDFELGHTLLSVASENSLIGLFWEARFARGEGDYARSAALLRRWLDLFHKRDGRYPKSIGFYVYDTDEATMPDFPRFIQGELGVVLVKQSDMMEALYAFDRAESNVDTAWVAEILITLDDLVAYAEARPKDARTAWFCAMVARRMLREGRVDEARIWLADGEAAWDPGEWPWEEYLCYAAQKRIAEDIQKPNDERALAYYNMARLVSVHGARLMKGESQLDYRSVWTYAIDQYRSSLNRFFNWLGDDAMRHEVLGRKDMGQFHYRRLGMDYAMMAAELAQHRDLKAAALLLGGAIPWGHDPERSDVFFKRLCALRPHPLAEAVNARNWFSPAEQRAIMTAAAPLAPQTLQEVVALIHALTE